MLRGSCWSLLSLGGLHAKERELKRLKKKYTHQKVIHNENSKAVLYMSSLNLFAMSETCVLVVRFLCNIGHAGFLLELATADYLGLEVSKQLREEQGSHPIC
jgi:hypothetical protein